MTNKELELIVQLTEFATTIAELKAENKILKDINEKLMQALRIHGVAGRSEQLLCPICSSENVDAEFNHYNFCRDCNHDWEK